MKFIFRCALSIAMFNIACAAHASASELEGIKLEESPQVAGKNLKLNGAGIGLRFVFKVYAISLYLLERKNTVEEVLGTDEPRRISILMLRDVSGDEFAHAVADSLASRDEKPERLLRLTKAISARPNGLRKGDTLTLDWVPGVGAVIELNKKPLVEPLLDKSFYNTLLNVWLGTKPADPSLKSKLLGIPSA
jgi:hypothetical protein